jgi:uncharacterized protein YcgI (DUF1989 family)
MPNIRLIPARRRITTALRCGQSIKIIHTHGTQSTSFWAFSIAQTTHHLSTMHTHSSILKANPEGGDMMVSNERKAKLVFIKDTTGGKIDTFLAACDRWQYEAV